MKLEEGEKIIHISTVPLLKTSKLHAKLCGAGDGNHASEGAPDDWVFCLWEREGHRGGENPTHLACVLVGFVKGKG